MLLVLAASTGCGSNEEPQGPPTPQALEAKAGGGRQAMVRWAPVAASNLDHYGLYWRQGSGSQSLLATIALPDTGTVIPRLQPGIYAFAVESVDSAGRASTRSPEVAVTIPTAPQSAIPVGTDSAPNGYYEYLPPGYGDGIPRPLLVFWHGSGVLGNGSFDLDRLLDCCPPAMVNAGRWPASLPFVLLSPQTNLNCNVGDEPYTFMAWALAHYTVDPKRVYITGMSCGSIRTWMYLGTHTDDQVAAVWLLSGDPLSAWDQAGCNLGKVAISAFHGTADTVVPIGPERAVMHSLMACPAPPRKGVMWTEVPDAGHEVAWEGYEGDAGLDALNWLLAQ
ncbi:MAG TPA: hypothetical protein VLT82_22585, partial [Myxococcaceae bacterium]|nr:hypothetical protein [Myxococcaceae bacterium]